MNIFKGITSMYFSIYTKTTGFFLQFSIWILTILFLTENKNLSYVPYFTYLCIIIYLLMVWVSFTTNEVIPEKIEQLNILKIKSIKKYTSIKSLYIILVGVCYSIIGIILSLVLHFVYWFQLFKPMPSFSTIFYSIFIIISYASIGGMIGSIFNGNLIKNRNTGVLLTFFLAIMPFYLVILIKDFPFLNPITYVLPMLPSMTNLFSRNDFISFSNVLVIFSYSFIYCMIINFIVVRLVSKYKFQ